MLEMKPTDQVYNFVIEKIKSSVWTPNTKIMSENELAAELNVSRVSVREALEKLKALGLIVKKRGSGTFINNLDDMSHFELKAPVLLMDDSDMLDLLKFRKYFESGNIRMFVSRCTERDLSKLEEEVLIMESTNSHKAFAEADFVFHNIIANGTENAIVQRMNAIMMSILEEHQHVLNKRIGSAVGIEFHRQILEAIQNRDSDLASILMSRHIDAAIEDYIFTSQTLS